MYSRKSGKTTGHFIVTDKVPIPEISSSPYRGIWSVFMSMKKGQSFTIPMERYKQARSAISWWSKRYEIKLHMAKEGDHYRIWRRD